MSRIEENAGDGTSLRAQAPKRISHYLIEDVLGEGGFGRVYLGYDTRLDRRVAIKVFVDAANPLKGAALSGIQEARTLAGLDHPNIVPVFDVGETQEGLVFIVSKFIEGETLASWMRRKSTGDRPCENPVEVAKLISGVAWALHYAHEQGVVHRDVKPGNIMIDSSGVPMLIDFGIALPNEQMGKGRSLHAGTPPYMSPEQARGKAHLVDGKSDIFSLGVILYEMLTGTPPFEGATVEIMQDLQFGEVVPPSHINASAAGEMERICLSALARLPGDRPDSLELTRNLEQFLGTQSIPAESTRAKVVPKGLLSFDEKDADFFLELIPGSRDQEGLPEIIRFWKQKIEAADPDSTFRVGLVYGPSGCGKSSLIKAGLIPRLSPSVVPIFVEAGDRIVERSVRAIHRRFPRLDEDFDLRRLLRRLRDGEGVPLGCKVLLIIDQFEQHMHHNGTDDPEMINALRQCDGIRMMSLLLVRDDFWTGVSKVFSSLEVNINTGHNARVVDLFDLPHAENVLAKFGRAFGALPENPIATSRSQLRFLKRAVELLASDEKVFPVRLALFADMFKGRQWTVGSLNDVGGLSGLGVLFLEECFGRRSQNKAARRHAEAAPKLLAALLPDSAADIKGRSRSRIDLAGSVGRQPDSEDFRTVLELLIKEFRLVTPTSEEQDLDEPRYGLTHDYLTPSIRTWINHKKLETRSGRAELKRREIADRWAVSRSPRLLPSLPEWAQIRACTSPATWSQTERDMMAKGTRRVLWRLLSCVVVGGLVLFAVWEVNGRIMAEEVHSRLRTTRLDRIDSVIDEMRGIRRWINPKLKKMVAESHPSSREALFARLALAPVDSRQQKEIVELLYTAAPADFPYIVAAIQPLETGIVEAIHNRARNENLIFGNRNFRATAALFLTAADEHEVAEYGKQFFSRLLERPPSDIVAWSELMSARSDASGVLLGQYRNLPVISTNDSKRRAKAAIALLHLEESERVWELLDEKAEPSTRTFFIDYLRPGIVPISRILRAMKNQRDPHYLAGLLESLGAFPLLDFDDSDGKEIVDLIHGHFLSKHIYVRSAARCLIHTWGLQFPPQQTMHYRSTYGLREICVGDWFVNDDGQEFAIVSEVDNRILAVATTELSIATFQNSHEYDVVSKAFLELVPNEACPAIGLRPQRVLAYCNDLSLKEELNPCYYSQNGKWYAHDDYQDRNGYRMPTLEEWMHAAKAGCERSRYFGDSTEALGRHAWYHFNAKGRMHSVGKLVPNPLGLHDMLGNAAEWTHSSSVTGSSDEWRLHIVGGQYRTDEVKTHFDYVRNSLAGPDFAAFRLVRTIATSVQGVGDELENDPKNH